MENIVLFVDRDQKFLLNIKEILEPYKRYYSIVISGSVQAAIRKLHSNNVSVLFLKYFEDIPEYSYFLSILNNDYPEVSVILYGDVENPKEILSFNDLGPKPLIIKDLDHKRIHDLITTVLEEQRDGGIINGVDLSLLMQLLEAEQKSCSLRVYNNKTKERGLLFFDKGKLVSAKTASNKDLDAAKEIIGWEQTTILIQNRCLIREGRSIGSLRAIILDSMREKDESKKRLVVDQSSVDDSTSYVAQKINDTFSNKWRPMKIYQDPYWARVADRLKGLGEGFGFGNLRALFIQQEGERSKIIVVIKDTVVLDVENNCPRDRLLRAFLV